MRRWLRRSQVLWIYERLGPCLVGMEACSRARHWATDPGALGHGVQPIPPACAKPCVTRAKTDAADAEAICEAITRPTRRCVPVTSADRQAGLPEHTARDVFARQRTRTANAIRAHLSEFGIVVATGIHNLDRLLEAAREVPGAARPALDLLVGQLRDLSERIDVATTRITAARKADPLARRLATISGLGAIVSLALASTTPDVPAFRTARACPAWLRQTPAGALVSRQGATPADLLGR